MSRFPTHVVRFVRSEPIRQSARGLPLALVHINKTAGTTFTTYLRSHFLSYKSVAPPFLGNFDQIGIADRSRELYWGHFTFAQFIEHRPEAWFLTFLRDPTQRVISQYRSFHNPANSGGRWDQVLPEHAKRALEFARGASFEEFVLSDDPFILGHIQDLQTRFVSSHADGAHPEFLTSAKRNLEQRFLFVGTTDSFEDSIRLFRYQLSSDHEYRASDHQRNVSPPIPVNMSAAAKQRVAELVRNDQALYDFAVGLLAKRIECLRQLEGEGDHRWAA